MFYFVRLFVILAIIDASTSISTSKSETQYVIKGCKIERKTILCYESNHTELPEIIYNEYTKNIIGIVVHNREIPVLPDNIYKNFSVTTLDLSDNKIELISNKTFSKMVTAHFFFTNNALKTIDFIFGANSDSESCSNMGKNLKTINLKKNKISFLKNGSFDCLKKIEKILFPANNMDQIETGVFKNLSTVISIDLSFNRLTTIDFLFESNTRMTHLELRSNNILINRTSPFKNLLFLNSLSLDSNNINEIFPETFIGLTRLTTLGLSFNNISRIGVDSFRSLRFLRLLDMQSNRLTEIDSIVFMGNMFIRILMFQNNMITSINKTTFQYTKALDQLFLNNNQIKEIQDDSFVMTPTLFYLDIRSNRLTKLTNRTLKGLVSLSEIDLSVNQIQTIDQLAFLDQRNLLLLNLSNNKLEYLNFKLPSNIGYVYLDFNRISFIEKEMFKNNKILSILTLNDNLIKSLSTDMFLSTIIMQMNFKNNRISEIEPGFFRRIISNLGKPLVSLDLTNNNLSRIKTGDFNDLTVKYLDFSHNQLQTIEKNAFQNSSISEIKFEHNKISSIQPGAFNGMYQLEFLDLSFNILTEVKAYQFNSLQIVGFMDLANNQIETINMHAFSGLKSLMRLSLKSNPLKMIYPIDNLIAFSSIYVSKITLSSLGDQVLISAFNQTEIIKENIYVYYKAVFLVVDEADIYDKEFCLLTFNLIRHNILVNFLEDWQVDIIFEKCLEY